MDSGQRRPEIVSADGGTSLTTGPIRVTVRVSSDHSDRFTLVDYEAPPGFAAPPVLHHHTREDWAAHVTHGELTFIFADGEAGAPAGSTVLIPAGCDFAWRNDHTEPARFLAIHAPAGFDRFFLDVASGVADRGGEATPEVMREVVPALWDTYGIEPAAAGGPA